MDLNLISLIITGVILFILAISILFGVIRGFKKSLVYGLINIGIIIILVIFMKSITNALIHLDLSGLNISYEGDKITTLHNFVLDLLQQEPTISDLLGSNPESIKLITALPTLILSPILFVVLYWLIKLVVFIGSLIYGLIALIVRPFIKKKNLDARGKVIKPKKRRLIGLAIGFATGLLIIFATFTPVFGIANICKELNNYIINTDGTVTHSSTLVLHAEEDTEKQQTLFTLLLGDQATEYIALYDNCIGIGIARMTGMEALGTTTFNNLTTAKIDNEEIKLSEEINSVISVFNDYTIIANNLKKETLTEQEMSTVITSAESLVNNVFNIKTIKILGNIIIPNLVDGILNDPDYSIKLPENVTQDQITNAIVVAALEEIQTLPLDDIKNVLLELVSTVKILNDNHIIVPIYNAVSTSVELKPIDYINLVKASNETFATDLSTKLTSLTFIQDISPVLVDSGMSALFESLDLTYSTNNITSTKAANILNTVLTNAINLIKTLDTTSELYVSSTSFGFAGNVLDITKDTDVLTVNQYNSLVNKVEELLNSYETPIDLTSVIDNLSEVNSWSTEMEKLGLAYTDFCTLYAEISKKEQINLSTLNLTNVGKVFDSLEQTTLFGGELKNIYNNALDTASVGTAEFNNVLNVLKINESTINWEKELTSLKPIITQILTLQNLEFTDINSTFAILDIVDAFDAVENDTTSTIYSAKMAPLYKEVMISAQTAFKDTQMIVDISGNIINRINNRTNETLKVCTIKGIFDYATILIPDVSEFDNANVQSMINEIKTNINNANNGIIEIDYEAELDYIIEFANHVETLKDFENLTDEEIITFANFLDTLEDSLLLGHAKSHVINLVIDTAISIVSENDKYHIANLLEDLKETSMNNNIKTLIEDLNLLKEEDENITIPHDITTLDADKVANSLNSIKNTDTFDENFTNTIFINALKDVNIDVQNDILIPDNIKTDVDNYIQTQIETLPSMTITDSTYKSILDGLLNLFPSV